MWGRKNMKASINHHLFNELPLDSGSLTMACSVVHNFAEPGNYACSVISGDRVVSRFHIDVNERYEAKHLTIDIAGKRSVSAKSCDCGSEAADSDHLEINPKGWVVFYVSRGAGGFAVKADGKLLGDREKKSTFDTRKLQASDMFTVSLLRPGTHAVTSSTGAKGKITVSYPGTKKGQLFNKAKPAEIRCLDNTFEPKDVSLEAAQGLIFRVESKGGSRIRIELSKGDDGPKKEGPAGVHRWRRPPRPKPEVAEMRIGRAIRKTRQKAK